MSQTTEPTQPVFDLDRYLPLTAEDAYIVAADDEILGKIVGSATSIEDDIMIAAAMVERVNDRQTQKTRIANLTAALNTCAQWFDEYADNHAAKGNDEKAAVNRTCANFARGVAACGFEAVPRTSILEPRRRSR